MNASQRRVRPAVDDFLKCLVRTTLIVGKGGVGKTTCAVGAAARLSATGETTLLVSTDPAESLGPALGISLAHGIMRQIESMPGLSAMQLDSSSARQRFLGRWRDVLVTILDRGTYLDAEDIGGLVDTAFPGADEIFGLLVLAELLANDLRERETSSRFARLVIDTAPTGHTLRLLALPETFDALMSLLESMQSKHRFMVKALTHRYRRDAADEFLEEMRGMLTGLRSVLGDASQSRAVLVTRAEPVVANESARYVEALEGMGITLAAIVVEALSVPRSPTEQRALSALRAVAIDNAVFAVPEVNPAPANLEEMRQSLEAMTRLERTEMEGGEGIDPRVQRNERERGTTKRLRELATAEVRWIPGGAPSAPASPLTRLLRVLTIVGGKGGVGKTTVACAVALAAALEHRGEGEILLVSTDPAPSLGDALGIDAPRWAHDGPVVIPEVPHLCVWQMDAGAAFQSLRDRYRDRIDALFDAVIGRGLDVAHDRAIMRDLLSLAPPGIDELYALASLGEALGDGRFERIIVDPAPTGHLLRLLELPVLAIDWSHRLMRLIMKYKDIVGLGDAAADLINFSRRTRALEALLHDATRAGVVLVSLDEPVVVAESARLAISLRQRQVAVVGEVWNRFDVDRERTDASRHNADRQLAAATVFEAPLLSGPLVGLDAIRKWSDHWVLRHSNPTS